MHIIAPMVDAERFMHRRYDEVLIELSDGRHISPEQRRKAHVIIGEIADWQGDIPEAVKQITKMDFMVSNMNSLAKKMFSLADCDMTTAREFISYLIDFVLRWDVPTKMPLVELCEDIERMVFACLMHKKCAICGKKRADLHHVDRVGMGRNRKTIIHEGMLVMPLCRAHHSECHTMEQGEFDERYHIVSIAATKEICKRWGLKHEAV